MTNLFRKLSLLEVGVRRMLCIGMSGLILFAGLATAQSVSAKRLSSQASLNGQLTPGIENGSRSSIEEHQNSDAQSAAASDAPGPVHRDLASRVGEYVTTTTFQAPGGGPSAESTGAAKIRISVDGRFLVEENSGSLMGQPVQGLRLLGYNNQTKRYESVWTYSMSTAMLVMTGTSPDNGKTVNLSGSFEEGGNKQTLHAIFRFIDESRFVVELRTAATGDTGSVVATTYTRKK
jgi:hypothetical protein